MTDNIIVAPITGENTIASSPIVKKETLFEKKEKQKRRENERDVRYEKDSVGLVIDDEYKTPSVNDFVTIESEYQMESATHTHTMPNKNVINTIIHDVFN